MKNNFWYFTLSFALFLTTACVSSSEHDEVVASRDKLDAEVKKTRLKVNELETLVAELERKLGAASANKKNMSASIQLMKDALKEATARKKETEKRMEEYRTLIRRFRKLTKAGDLSIKIVDGRMVVALESDVLFSSGSARLSNKGNDTIKKVAKLLVSIPDKKFQIEGHTDNVPIRSSKFPSNWELASARSINVLKTMKKAGMPAERISAASFSDTAPVASNKEPEGKAANRRIEIVVIPDLSQLPGYDELQRLSEQK